MKLMSMLGAFVLALFGGAHSQMPAPIVPPPALAHILVVVDDRGDSLADAKRAGDSASIALTHFARTVSWAYSESVTPADVEGADAVVYFGRASALPPAARALAAARRLIVFNQHLAQFQALGVFPNVLTAREVVTPPRAEIAYKNQRFAVIGKFYTRFTTRVGAHTFGTINANGTTPLAIVDGRATFIATPLTFASEFIDPYRQGAWLAACDLLRIGLDAPPEPRIALLRFEDVSVEVPTGRMRAIADYMASRDVPYGIGVIPDQLIKGVTLRTLSQDPELVQTLRFAQSHGARIVLHGLHHSFNSPEDFEFWDAVHNQPLPQDSPAWMTDRVTRGLDIERGLGLDPVMWESPHYSASPLDYRVVATFFGISWERRRPVAFLPWALQRDQYSSALLPENLGYVSVGSDKRMTLRLQLARARAFSVCADCIPAGFLHPSTVPLADVIDYVNGLQALGYRFADPLAVIAPERT